MFDIGWGELVVIGIVALIAIGPKELPTVLRSLGQWMGKIRRMANEFQGQFQEAMREAEMADLKKQADDLASTVSGFGNVDPLASAKKDIESAFETPAAKDTGLLAEPPAAAAGNAPSSSELPAPAEQTAPLPQATPLQEVSPLPEINVPLPEPMAPLTEKDFAPADLPPPKKAGGGG
jgi:sec-independent protein translocase protein TatB